MIVPKAAVSPCRIGSSAAQRFPIFATCRPIASVVYAARRRRRRRTAASEGRRRLSTDAQIANREAARAYCVIPFLLPLPENPCAARAQKASQAGRRRFDPGRPLFGTVQPDLFRRPADADVVATGLIAKCCVDLASVGFS